MNSSVAVHPVIGHIEKNNLTVKDLSELYFNVNYVHKQETLETVFAVMLPLLFIAAIVFVVIAVHRRKKKLNK